MNVCMKSVKRRGRLFVQILSIKTQEGEDGAPARDAALTDYFEKLETLLKEKVRVFLKEEKNLLCSLRL